MMGMYGLGGGWMMVFWWVIIFAAIIGIINLIKRNQSENTVGETALDILRKRYARGEIDTGEFERIKKEILDS
ncbi:MAG: SHOCT domain-containing protein [FCB group bacterium]|nr:SHOCT domain-containing protein [FCB group bacterium]